MLSLNRRITESRDKIRELEQQTKGLAKSRDKVLAELGAHMINSGEHTIVVPVEDYLAAIVRLDRGAFSSPIKLGDEATVDIVRLCKT